MNSMNNNHPTLIDNPELTEYLDQLRQNPEGKRYLFQLSPEATKEDVAEAVEIINKLSNSQ